MSTLDLPSEVYYISDHPDPELVGGQYAVRKTLQQILDLTYSSPRVWQFKCCDWREVTAYFLDENGRVIW